MENKAGYILLAHYNEIKQRKSMWDNFTMGAIAIPYEQGSKRKNRQSYSKKKHYELKPASHEKCKAKYF